VIWRKANCKGSWESQKKYDVCGQKRRDGNRGRDAAKQISEEAGDNKRVYNSGTK